MFMPDKPAKADKADADAEGADTTGSTPGVRNASIRISPMLVISGVAIVLLILALFLKESPQSGSPSVSLWSEFGVAWSLFALAAAVLTLTPSFARVLNIGEPRAWQLAALGAGALVFWWVLFVLPAIDRNVSFLATLAVALAGVAVWLSPGNTLQDAAAVPAPES